ncbi:MAG: hypothetical protein L6408_02335 [Nanoarchaeota archaeon]|nr:hypothetical protein [Nanoarchaeota archaeon]
MKKFKTPNSFRLNTEIDEKKLEELIKKTKIKNLILEDVGQQIREYLEAKNLADEIKLEFNQLFHLKNEPEDFKTEITDSDGDLTVKGRIPEIKAREVIKIREDILELYPNIKPEEVVYNNSDSFSIICDDFIFSMSAFGREYNSDCTNERWKNPDKNKGMNKAYFYNVRIDGNVKYSRFNKKLNEDLVKVFEKNGYDVTMKVIKPKCNCKK